MLSWHFFLVCFIFCSKRYNRGKVEPRKKNRRIEGVGGEGKERKQRGYRVRSISTQIPTNPTRKSGPPHKVDQFFRNFSVGLNRSIQFWTEISKNFGSMDRAHILPAPSPIIFCFNLGQHLRCSNS